MSGSTVRKNTFSISSSVWPTLAMYVSICIEEVCNRVAFVCQFNQLIIINYNS